MIKKVIDLFPMKREYNLMFTGIFYMYFEQYYSGAKSSLYQIFIKKEVVDSLLYISTPYGWPLPIKASEVLSSLQKNNFKSSILPKINHSNFGEEINKLNINPEATKNRLHEYRLKNNLDNLQARYVASAEEIIMKDDNVIIFDYNKDFSNDLGKNIKLYRLITDLILYCKDFPECFSEHAHLYDNEGNDDDNLNSMLSDLGNFFK